METNIDRPLLDTMIKQLICTNVTLARMKEPALTLEKYLSIAHNVELKRSSDITEPWDTSLPFGDR